MGMRNERFGIDDDVDEVLDRWSDTICNDVERRAAKALLVEGMERRPRHAIERAHVVLVAVGLVADVTEVTR